METELVTWKTALEHVLEVYNQEYADFLKETQLEQNEDSALTFLQGAESNLE